MLAGLGGVTLSGLAFQLARLFVTPSRKPDEDVTVLDLIGSPDAPESVWLTGTDADLTGRYSFIFDGGAGHAKLGPVVATSGSSVARPVIQLDRGRIHRGTRGHITGWWFDGPDELGLRVERVSVPLPGGDAWGWLIHPADAGDRVGEPGTAWALHVHGRGALPEETLRGVVPAARAGLTSLVLAYRNDPGAPRGYRGKYGLGISERHDVDAALEWMRERGAKSAVLFGWSMGATACVLAANRGSQRDMVTGLVLESPALDWPAILQLHARKAKLPWPVDQLARVMLARGWVASGEPAGVDLGMLTPEVLSVELTVPALALVSADDTFVHEAGALRLARLRPDVVTLSSVRGGEHVKLWNHDEAAWEREIDGFLERLAHRAP